MASGASSRRRRAYIPRLARPRPDSRWPARPFWPRIERTDMCSPPVRGTRRIDAAVSLEQLALRLEDACRRSGDQHGLPAKGRSRSGSAANLMIFIKREVILTAGAARRRFTRRLKQGATRAHGGAVVRGPRPPAPGAEGHAPIKALRRRSRTGIGAASHSSFWSARQLRERAAWK